MKHRLRQHLLDLLDSSHAHLRFEDVIANWPIELRGRKPPQAPHTAWQLLEHLRICQWDILEFSQNPDHQSPPFPEGYWPSSTEPPEERAWDRSVAAFGEDLRSMRDLIADEKADLFAPFPHAPGHTLLAKALLVADHNAYHLGQLVLLRKLLQGWSDTVEYRVES